MNSIVFLTTLLAGAALAELPLDLKLGSESAAALEHVAANYESLDVPGQIDTVNKFVDVIMKELQSLMITQGLDPMEMPDIHREFKFRPIIITYHGQLDLNGGWLRDTSTLHRGGNVTVDYTDRILTIDIPLNFKNFVFNYDYSIKIMNLGPTGGLDGTVKDIRVLTVIQVDFKDPKIILKNFKIKKTGDINLKFHGNVITDWIVNIVSGVITTIFKGLINSIVQMIVGNTLNDLFELINRILSVIKP